LMDVTEKYGCSSETGPLKRLLLKHPREAFVDDERIADQWVDLNYLGCPDFRRAVEEYDRFIELLEEEGRELIFLPSHPGTGLDSVYVRDAMVMVPEGGILANMGKRQRRGEPEAMRRFLSERGIPLLGEISGEGRLEGGDVVLFDRRAIAVGEGYRTNREGIRQLRETAGSFFEDFLVVPLPHWNGPGDVLHLMSIISPVAPDLAVVYSRLMPVPFRRWLLDRGIRLVEVPDQEFETMGCNVLALAPRKAVMLAGNPRTRSLLEAEGVEVLEYRGEEISKKGSGGPTCLTRPLFRGEAT